MCRSRTVSHMLVIRTKILIWCDPEDRELTDLADGPPSSRDDRLCSLPDRSSTWIEYGDAAYYGTRRRSGGLRF